MAKALSDIFLAKEFGVNRSTVFRWRAAGLPDTRNLELVRQWVEARKAESGKEDDAVKSVEPVPVSGNSPYDVRDRLQVEEAAIASEIQGIKAALDKARKKKDEKAVSSLSIALRAARKQHREQADSLLKAEARVVELEESRGNLISLDAAKDLLSKCFSALRIWTAALVVQARDGKERELLTGIQERIYAIVRQSIQESG
jgi:hypothetical protein